MPVEEMNRAQIEQLLYWLDNTYNVLIDTRENHAAYIPVSEMADPVMKALREQAQIVYQHAERVRARARELVQLGQW